MKNLAVFMCCLVMTACGAMEGVGDNIASLFKTSSQYREESAARFNKWLGKHKDERIKAIGPPVKCAVLSSGEESCEWSKSGISGSGSASGGQGSSSFSSWEHRVIFTYDREGIARQWSYNGNLGSFTSADYPVSR